MSFYIYNETKMYYETVGEGTPFLIVHGWAIDHRFTKNMMEPVFKSLHGSSFKRIYIDLPGMGVSLPGKITNGDGILEVLDSFMEENFPGEKFYIGGNSFGAGISRAYTAMHPEKVLGLMLIVPSTGKLGKLPASGVAEKDVDFLKTLSNKDRAAFSCMNAILTETNWRKYKEEVLPSVLINEDNEFLHKKFHGVFGFDIDAAFRKKPYPGPVLIVCGKYDTAVGYEDQQNWLNLYPCATYHVIDKAGHNIFVDRPDEFDMIVSDWISQLPSLKA